MQTNKISLYDYLGKSAGRDLGKQVAEYAKIKNSKYETRHISNVKYTGHIMLYDKEFLDEFFTVQKFFQTPSVDYTEINTALTEDSFKESEKIF
jgi:hypothetical protein